MSELSEDYEEVCKELDELIALCESQKEEREQVSKRARELNDTVKRKNSLEEVKSSIFNQWVQEEIQQDNREFATPLIRVMVKSEEFEEYYTGNQRIYENWGFYRVEDCLVRVSFKNDFEDANYIENFFGDYDTREPYFVSHTIEDFIKGKQISDELRNGILYSSLRHVMNKGDLRDYSSNPYIEIVVYDDTIKKWFPETPHENFYPENLCQDEPHPEFCNEENRKDEYKYFTIRWEN